MEGLESRSLLAAFTPGNLAVYRVGDGASSLSNSGSRVFIDEYTPSGALVQSLAMPHTGGDVKLIANGFGAAEGMLTLSPDGTQLTLTGYNSAIPTAATLPSTTSTIQRTVAVVGADGAADLYSFSGTTISNSDVRSAIVDGSKLYISGGANGIRYASLDSLTPGSTGNATIQVSGVATDVRDLTIAAGQLYASSNQSSAYRIGKVGNGTPTTTGQMTASLLGTTTLATPHQMFFADLSPTDGVDPLSPSKGLDTLYVSDDGAAGLRKYSFNNTTSQWASMGSIGGDSDDYRGLTGVVSGSTVTLYAVRKGGTTAAGGGELVTLVDASGYNGAFAGTPALIASATTEGANNTAFRGVAFVPSSGAVNQPPTFVDAGPYALPENSASGTVVGTVTASDPDAGQVLTFSSLGTGTGASLFQIDASGQVTVSNAAELNFEGVNSFTFGVRVTDNGSPPETADVMVTIHLADVNEAPDFPAGAIERQLLSGSASGTVVSGGAVIATDPDHGDSVTSYAIVGGNGTGVGAFAISSSGVITVNDSSQIALGGVFNLQVTASDSFGLASAPKLVTVNVVANSAPVFAPDIYGFSVAENEAADAYVGSPVAATDPDAGFGDVVTFSIVAGNGSGSGAFKIDPVLGQIQVNDSTQLDFEAIEAFNLTIRATDKAGLFDTATVSISIINAPEPPTIPAGQEFVIVENRFQGTSVGVVIAEFDSEMPPENRRFTISGGNGTGTGAFAIDNSGNITVNDATQVDYEAIVNHQFNLIVTASNTGASSASTSQTVVVRLTNLHEGTLLEPGDLLVTGINGDDNDEFSFVTLVDLAARTEIRFTDAGFATSGFRAGEGVVVYVAPAGGIAAGTELGVVKNASTGMVSMSHGAGSVFDETGGDLFSIGTTGDSLIAFQGIFTAPFPLFALTTRRSSFDAGASDEMGTSLPIGLTLGETALAIGDFASDIDNAEYRGTTIGDFATLRAGVANAANWFRSNSRITLAYQDFIRNVPPTNLALDNNRIPENASAGSVVGVFNTTDADPGDFFFYSLVGGAGSTDNASFVIDGASLKTAGAFDFEAKNSYSIRVRSTDRGNEYVERQLSILVTNENDAPTWLDLSSTSIIESAPLGAVVGYMSTQDQDASDSFTYSFAMGPGSEDNASFVIVGAELRSAALFDAQAKSQHFIRLRSTDGGGAYVERAFVIHIGEVNSPPTAIALSNASIVEQEPAGAIIGTLSTIDPDSDEPFIYSFVSGEGASDNASFVIDGATLKSSQAFDFRAKNLYSIRIRSTDSGGLHTEQVFLIRISDVRIDGLSGAATMTYRENAQPALVAGAATISDIERLDFEGGTLRAWLSSGAEAEDQISIRSAGVGGGQISVVDNRVYYTKIVNQSLSTSQIGEFSGGAGSTPLIVEFNSNAFRLEVQATLRALVFENQSDTPSTMAREISFAITDRDGGTSNIASRGLNVLPVNDAPSIAVNFTSVEYQPAGAAVVIDSGVMVTDVDSPNFDGGRLIVWIAAGGQPTDRLEISTGGRVTVDSANQTVSYDGELVGVFSGATRLAIGFNHLATQDVVQAVAQRIAYRSLLPTPSSTRREISFLVTDGDGGTSSEAQGDHVRIGIANSAPELILRDDAPARFVENASPILIANTAIVNDVDLWDFDQGILSATIIGNGVAADQLSIQNSIASNGKVSADVALGSIFYTTNAKGTYQVASFTGGVDGNPLLITFNTHALKTEVQAVMRAITFSNDSEDPSTAPRTVQFTLTDGDGGLSDAVTRTIEVVARNDAAVISNFGDDISWTRDSGATLLAPNAAISDVDSADFLGGKLVVALNANVQSTDRIEISEGDGITLSGDAVLFNGQEIGTFAGKSSLTITFTTTAADQVAVEALLRRITFRSTSTSLLTRGVRVILHDGDGGASATRTKQIFVDNP